MTARDPEPLEEGEKTLSPFGLIWRLMTSPKTLMLSSAILGVLIALGTYITQGATEADLLQERSYAVTQAIIGLGLNQLGSSWLTWLFALLTTLSLIGLALRTLVVTPLEGRQWRGPALDTLQHEDARDLPTMRGVVSQAFGTLEERQGALVLRQGFWFEGLSVVAISVLCLLAGLLVGSAGGMEARMGVRGGGAAPAEEQASTLAVQVLEDGTWIERQLPFNAQCVPTALVDPRRGWRCTLQRTLSAGPGVAPTVESAELSLGPQWPDEAFGMRFHVEKEHPVPALGERIQLVDPSASGERLLYSGPPGRTATLSSGLSLTAFAGPDGPLVIAREKGERPRLLVPAQDLSAEPAAFGEVSVSALTPWWLTLRVSKRPGQALIWAGLGLLLLGILLCVGPRHRVIIVSARGEGTSVSAWSLNRAEGVQGLTALLSEPEGRS